MNPMFSQYKQKPKRKVNPDIPRPNLFSHDKKLREIDGRFDQNTRLLDEQNAIIAQLQRKVARLQNQVDQLTTFLKSKER